MISTRRLIFSRYSSDNATQLARITQRAFNGTEFGKLMGGAADERQVKSLARYFDTTFRSISTDIHIASQAGQPVGFVIWKYPFFMERELDKELGRVRTEYNPPNIDANDAMFNPRILKYSYEHGQIHARNELSITELEKLDERQYQHAVYPQCLMPNCMMVAVLPQHQQQGIAKRLITESIRSIPDCKYGSIPLKLNIWATSPEAVFVYEKCGFRHASRARTQIASTNMTLLRKLFFKG